MAIVLSVIYHLRILITPVVSCGHCVVCHLPFTDSDYSCGILWPLCCLSSTDLRIMITLWYLVAIVLSVIYHLRILITPLVSCGHVLSVIYHLRILITPLVSCGHCVVCHLHLRILITPVVSCGHCVVCHLRLTDYNYLFGILWPLCCLSSTIYGF